MTRYELHQKLTQILTDLHLIQNMLEQAIRASVPPDIQSVVQLVTIAKLVCSILAKLDELEPTALEESA